MTGYLVDTDVISAGAPTKARAPQFAAWMDTNSARLSLSAVSVAEIEEGIAKARRDGATKKAQALEAWFDTLLHLYGGRVLAFDTDTARIAGRLADRVRGRGHSPGFADTVIAATALNHDLVLLTRNTKDFAQLGVRHHDPFVALPD